MTSLVQDAGEPDAASQIDRLRLALERGEDPFVALLGPAQRRLRARVGLPRRLDRALFDAVLDEPGPGEPFDRLVELGVLYPVPGRLDWFVADEDWRARAESPAEIASGLALADDERRALHARLARYFEAAGEDGELEALHHALAAGEASAPARWRKHYVDARDRFDVARCESLLQLLSAGYSLPPSLVEEGAIERSLLASRAAFADDHFRTVRYMERDTLLKAFEAMPDANGRFILQLYAPGGSGKTMFLRWLGAHWCLPHGVAIARLDFDFLAESDRGLSPAFLLGRLAEKLDPQLPGAPFVELLRDVADARRRGSAGAAFHEEVLERFTATLAERCSGREVVLVLDTLEDATLRHQVDMLTLMRCLADVRERLHAHSAARPEPRLVLIVSGRYSFEEQYPVVHEALGAQTRALLVQPFDGDESRAYLRKRLAPLPNPPDEALLALVVERAQGNPFKLELYADILLAAPGLEPAELGQGLDVDMLYLIQRVLKRLSDVRLRWLLRYGVLARRLTPSFVSEVLRPAIERSLRGDRSDDDPADDPVTHKDWIALWACADSGDIGKLWNRLREYASASSWISADAEAADALTIQPVVSHPMRRALLKRDRRVVARIHKLAVARARATRNWTSEAERLTELTYHDVQLRGAKAATAWRQRLVKARDGVVRRALASVLLSEDLRQSESHDGEALVPPWAVAHAHAELAMCELQEIGQDTPADVARLKRAQARAEFAAFERWRPARGEPLLPAHRVGELLWLLAEDEPGKSRAIATLEDALGTRLPGDRRDRVLELLAAAHAVRAPERAAQIQAERERLSLQRGDAESYGRQVLSQAWGLLHSHRCGKALAIVAAARATLHGDAWKSRENARRLRGELMAVESEALVRLGLPGAASALLKRHGQDIEKLSGTSEVVVSFAEMLLTQLDADGARTLAREVTGSVRPGDAASDLILLRAYQVEAHAALRLVDYRASLDAFDQATQLATFGGHAGTVTRLRQATVRALVTQIGDLRLAASYLPRELSMLEGESSWAHVERLCEVAAFHAARGEPAAARAAVEALERFDGLASSDWADRRRATLAGMAFDAPACRARHARRLLEVLAEVDDPGVRLKGMPELREMAAVEGVESDLVQEIAWLCRVEGLDEAGYRRLLPIDRLLATMAHVDLLRVLGARPLAEKALRGLATTAERLEPGLWQRELAACCGRLGVADEDVLPARWLEACIDETAPWPALQAVLRFEAAGRTPDMFEASRLLAQSLAALPRAGGIPARWQWQALLLQHRLADAHAAAFPGVDVLDVFVRMHQLRRALGALPERAEASIPPPREQAASLRRPVMALVVDNPRRVGVAFGSDYTEAEESEFTAPFVEALDAFARGDLAGSAARPFVDTLLDDDFGRRLAYTFLPSDCRAALTAGGDPTRGVDFVVRTDEGRTSGRHAMPWELMTVAAGPEGNALPVHALANLMWRDMRLPETHRTRLHLAELALQPSSRLAPEQLADWQRHAGLPATGVCDDATLASLGQARSATRRSVLVVRTAARFEQLRGASSSSLAWKYESAGLRAIEIEAADLKGLTLALREQTWSVVHLATPIGMDRSGGELHVVSDGYIDESSYRETMSASHFVRLLAESPGRPVPLVVVDTPRPSSPSEVPRQLLLRNAFSGAIADFGAVASVLAMGLADPWEGDRMTRSLTKAVARGLSPAEIARELRRSPAHEEDRLEIRPQRLTFDRLHTDGVALFAADPFVPISLLELE